MIREIAKVMIASALLCSLSACGNELKSESLPEEDTTILIETTSTDKIEVTREFMIEKYVEILEGIYTSQKVPNREDLDFPDGWDISENKFAIYDIDKDGRDELIIEYTTSSMAGMVELIYDFDSDENTLREEFIEFPNLTFYDNGIIIAGWSHNQGYAGEFWPYTLYQYNKNTDTYDRIGMVDAWDKSLSAMDYNGNLFPDDADLDKDGIVYYMMFDEEYNLDNPVDLDEYNQWYNSYIEDAKEVKIPFENFTETNIKNSK